VVSVRAAVEGEVAKLPADLRKSGLAATALVLADQLDDNHETACPECGHFIRGVNSATSKSMCSKELRETLAALAAAAPAKKTNRDAIDDLTKRRAKRRSASAASARS
jgi:hypothetical protein